MERIRGAGYQSKARVEQLVYLIKGILPVVGISRIDVYTSSRGRKDEEGDVSLILEVMRI